MTTVVTFHGNATSENRLKQALPGASFSTIKLEGGTNAYVSLTQRYPTLIDFMRKHAAQWMPGEPLVLLAFSAGTWALRYYLRDSAARALTNAVVIIDGLYGGVPCNLTPFEGVIAYAREANASPKQKRLILTYSLDTPAPAACTKAIENIASGPGLFIAEKHTGTHGAQLTEVGPDSVARFVAPWISSSRKKSRGKGVFVGAVIVAVGYGLLRSRGVL